MARFWMVRAGVGGALIDDFIKHKCVAVGFTSVGDFTSIDSFDLMRQRAAIGDPGGHQSRISNTASMCWTFRNEMAIGDKVVTYDKEKREYLLGAITGDYVYRPGVCADDYNHMREVGWGNRVSRDALPTAAKNTLGSVLAIFEPGTQVLDQLERAAAGKAVAVADPLHVDGEDDVSTIRQDLEERSHEFIKDRILTLTPEEMEQLVAALLRAMGFKARVTPTGPDRGRDVIASPDGLGLQQPRIFAEVKHRRGTSMGTQQVRSFLAGLRPGDCGLYVSVGGFTKEARYEAERANNPVTLVDLDELATLVVDNYETFDTAGKTLLPLMRVYWPSN